MKITDLSPKKLVPHPLNREFPRRGAEWAEFVRSVGEAGAVLVPLHVRPVGSGWQILAGHRRHAAAVECGLATVPCLVRDEMEDVDALAFLVNENLQRLELSPVDEGRLVAAMRDEMAMSEVEIAEKISRSVEWVRTRQLMLDLGDEVMFAVRDAHPDRHLTMGAVEEILKVPVEWREDAVQLVLHPEFEVRPLGPDQARDVLRKCLIEPRMAEKAWNAGLKKLMEMWKKRLKKLVAPGDDLLVMGVEWANVVSEKRNGLSAEDRVPEVEKTASAPAGLTWLALAVKHGLAVKVVPGEGDESHALVDARLLRLAEAARAEHGEEAWLVEVGKVEKGAGRVEAALSVLDGEGEVVYDANDEIEEMPPSEGKLEQWAWVDLRQVRGLAEIAQRAVDMADVSKEDLPEDTPEWARDMADGEWWDRIVDVCEWVMGLRKK